MHFGTKSYLKSTRNYTAKHALKKYCFLYFFYLKHGFACVNKWVLSQLLCGKRF